jgi:GR25 family glycosyltransferase involved in LPS biosynthesis
VITIGNPSRETNIQDQIEQQMNIMRNSPNKSDYFEFNIQKIDGVLGKNVDLDAFIEQGILYEGIYQDMDPKLKHITTSFNEKMENRKNEVGCYLSHYKTYETIRDRGNMQGYSVIFEDDFVLDPRFMNILDETLLKLGDIDFDMLFLGIIGDNGEQVLDNVYRTTGVSWCAHGYLVNNRHIEKILKQMRFIDNILDVQIFKKGNQGDLTILRLDPTIVEQGELGTNIRNN